jgi:tetratricopeptide (TPR) repeat protein
MSAMIPSASDEMHAQCDWKECSNVGKDKCWGCGAVRYCSRECQLKDWKSAVNPHKAMCQILKRREDTSGGSSSVPKCPASLAVLNTADEARIIRWRRMIDIGDNLCEKGEYDKAIQTFQRCLSDFADVEDAECLARTFHDMAVVYWKQGDNAKSVVFHEKALAIDLKVLGAEHPNVASSYVGMANVYDDQGNYIKALELQKKALVI